MIRQQSSDARDVFVRWLGLAMGASVLGFSIVAGSFCDLGGVFSLSLHGLYFAFLETASPCSQAC